MAFVRPRLFNPTAYGLTSAGFESTGCYSGYCCPFETGSPGSSSRARVLSLRTLKIQLREDIDILLNGVAPGSVVPVDQSSGGCGNVIYEDIGLLERLSGGLILWRDWMDSFAPSLGPELAWRFQSVSELQFEQGRLTNSVDCSACVALVREAAERYVASAQVTSSVLWPRGVDVDCS